MVDLTLVAGGLLALVVVSLPGVCLLWMGYAWYRISETVSGLEAVDPDVVSPGTVKVSGTAQPHDGAGTVESPVTETASLAYEFEVQGYKPDPGDASWHRIVDERAERRFRLSGTTEDPVVDVDDDFDLLLDGSDEFTVEGYDDAPPAVQRYVDDHGEDVLDWQRTKFVERRLEPGEEALVVGHATREPDRAVTTRVGKRDVSGVRRWLGQPLVVSDRPDVDVAGKQGTWAKLFFVAGGVWLAFAVVLLGVPILGAL